MNTKRIIAKIIRRICNPCAITESQIDMKAKICSGSQINYSSVGRYSYIGHNCFVLRAHVGSFCSIADSCHIGGAMHPICRVSSSPVFSAGKNILKKNFEHFPEEIANDIYIGSDVWIGAGVIVKSGVVIGNGSVIGAGSVVTKDVPPYEIWAGNPAHKIRSRFSDEVIDELQKIKWWDWDEGMIIKYSGVFDDPKKLIAVFRNSDGHK